MKILVSGSSGLVGTAVGQALSREGHALYRLARPQSKFGGKDAGKIVRWDPLGGEFEAAAAEGADAVVHLAGASIGEGRWSEERKRVLRSSRIEATRHLVSAMAKLSRPPAIFISASAVGYYGDRGEEELTEESAPGSDFLALLARDWEAEAARTEEFGARAVIRRFGIAMSASGGALPRMLLPFKLGAGGRLGSGRQWMSWVTLEDVTGIVRFALESAQARGPINAVSPNPVRNAEFTRLLARGLHRPAIFPAPAFGLRLLLGEMAGPLLLSSQRVLPRKLQQLGYRFLHAELGTAFAAVLGRAA